MNLWIILLAFLFQSQDQFDSHNERVIRTDNFNIKRDDEINTIQKMILKLARPIYKGF